MERLKIICLSVFVCVGGCDSKTNSEIASGRFKISNDRYRFEYAVDPFETSFKGALTMTGDQAGISEGGATKTLHYLSTEKAADFKNTHPDGECPAPYFNDNAQQRILIPENDEVAKKTSRIDFSDYRDSTKWRPFSVSGYCIRNAPVVEKDGKPGALPSNMFDDCLTILVKNIEIS